MGRRKKFGMVKRKVNKLLSDCNINLDAIDVNNKASIAVDIEGIAKHQNIKIIYHPFSNEISGVFYKKEGKLFLGVNSTHPKRRQRFTIAHELGHYILHSDDILHYNEKIEDVYFRADKIQSKEESIANHFAAEILMPAELIQKCINNGVEQIGKLSELFNVSEGAMRYRLINLGFL